MDIQNLQSKSQTVLTPKPLRPGETGYEDRVKRFCSENSGSILDSFPSTLSGCPPTLTTLVQPSFSLDNHRRNRLPCELYRNLPESKFSEFQHNSRVSTSNLIDWQTKEIWDNTQMRSYMYQRCPVQCGTGIFSQGIEKNGDHSPAKFEDNFESKISAGLTWPCEFCIACCTPPPFFHSQKQAPSPIFGTDSMGPLSAENCTQSFLKGGHLLQNCQSFSIIVSQPANTPSMCGERVFKCDFPDCRKSFTRKEELTRHKRTHSNDKAFECKVCSRKFIRKDHMMKHLATHEDVSKRRRYVCKEVGCNRRYTRSDALSRHRSAAHPDLSNFTPL